MKEPIRLTSFGFISSDYNPTSYLSPSQIWLSICLYYLLCNGDIFPVICMGNGAVAAQRWFWWITVDQLCFRGMFQTLPLCDLSSNQFGFQSTENLCCSVIYHVNTQLIEFLLMIWWHLTKILLETFFLLHSLRWLEMASHCPTTTWFIIWYR